jgi:hypothetical protein
MVDGRAGVIAIYRPKKSAKVKHGNSQRSLFIELEKQERPLGPD